MAGFDLTGSSVFTNADPKKTLAKIILQGDGMADHYSLQENVKYQTIIKYDYNFDVDVSTGNNSGYTVGSDGFASKDVTLTDKQLSFKGSYDLWNIQKYVNGLGLTGSDGSQPIPAEGFIMDKKAQALRLYNETFVWTADTSALNAFKSVTAGSTLNSYNGVLAQVAGVAGGYGWKAESFMSISDTSILGHINAIVDKMVSVAPALTSVQCNLSMGPEQFYKAYTAVTGINSAISSTTIGVDGKAIVTSVAPVNSFNLPGKPVTVHKEIGLQGVNHLFLTFPENVMYVTDLKSEDDKLAFFYSQDADKWIMRGNYKLGSAVVDPSLCFISA